MILQSTYWKPIANTVLNSELLVVNEASTSLLFNNILGLLVQAIMKGKRKVSLWKGMNYAVFISNWYFKNPTGYRDKLLTLRSDIFQLRHKIKCQNKMNFDQSFKAKPKTNKRTQWIIFSHIAPTKHIVLSIYFYWEQKIFFHSSKIYAICFKLRKENVHDQH